MAAVACFCGCYFTFDGGAGACPRCGEPVSLTLPAPEVRVADWTEELLPAADEVSAAPHAAA